MAIKRKELKRGKILEIEVSGKLTDEDYRHWIPEFERALKARGKISLLFEMTRFHGWEAKAAWDDLKFGIKHFKDIERIAAVGEKKWQQWMTALCKPFTTAEVRYFNAAEAEQARAWLEAEAAKEKEIT